MRRIIFILLLCGMCCISCKKETEANDDPKHQEQPTPGNDDDNGNDDNDDDDGNPNDPDDPGVDGEKIVIPNEEDLTPTVAQEGGTTTIKFTAKAPWRAAVSDTRAASDWLSVSPVEGNAGDVTLTIATETNETTDDREGYIKIYSGDTQATIAVTQKRPSLLYSDSDLYKIDARAQKVDIKITSDISKPNDIEYYITKGVEYYVGTRSVTADFTLNVDENTTGTTREGEIEFTPPDEKFRAYCIQRFDIDGDGILSQYEASFIIELSIVNQQIKSLEGIEYFTNLTKLDCSLNQLTSLNISKNTNLTKLRCDSNQLTSLDISKNTNLTYLNCDENQLTSLDLSKNTELTELHCSYNQLTSLDISKNTNLTKLRCDSNQLTSLDLSKNTELTKLYCRYNKLTSLDISKNTELTELDCGYNQLTSLDISKTKLYLFDCVPMPTLKTLRIKNGWSMNGITINRSTYYIPDQTRIIYVE